MPGEIGVAQEIAGRGDLAIFGVPSGFITGLRSGPIAGVPNSTRHNAAVADHRQFRMPAIMAATSGLGQLARLNHRRGCELARPVGREARHSISRRPLDLDFFNRGRRGLVSVVASVDMKSVVRGFQLFVFGRGRRRNSSRDDLHRRHLSRQIRF